MANDLNDVMMANDVKVKKLLCRTCLKSVPNTFSIFDYHKNDKLISEVLAELVNLEVQKNDNFPRNICNDCLAKLNVAYEFKMMALTSNVQLHHIYSNLIGKIKEEPPDVEYTVTEITVPVKYEKTDILTNDFDEECRRIKATIENLEENPVDIDEIDNEEDWIDIYSESMIQNINELRKEENQEDNTTNQDDEDLNESVNECSDSEEDEFDTSEYRELKNSLTGEEKMKARARCKICDKQVSYRCYISRHIHIHEGTLPHACSMCNRRFNSPTDLKTHILRKHENKRLFKCKTCEKAFKTTHELHTHQVVHSEKTYLCKICDKRFKSASYLKQHNEKHNGDRKRYFCEICGKTVMHPRVHKLIHNPEDSFTCAECGKQFKTKRAISLHVRIHSDVRNHVCSDCGKAFKKLQTLKEHQHKHSGIKPYVCKVCGKAFNSSGTLSRHKLTHTKERPHSCEKCVKTFRYSQQLQNHMKRFHLN